MKQIFRCEYCDKMGVKEDIIKHENECISNYTKRSCFTCKHAENKITRFICKNGQELPEGQIYEHCRSWEWDEKDHISRNPTAFNTLFGGLFG